MLLELSYSRIKVLSEISRDIAQVFFAIMVVSSLVSGDGLGVITLGLFASVVFWLASLSLTK